MTKLFIDIETACGPNKPDAASIVAPANYKDPAKIAAYQAENVDSAWRAQALNSLQGRIVCIGWAVEDQPVKAISGEYEDVLINSFWDEVQEHASYGLTWVGFNCRTFDLNWLYHRAVKYRFKTLAAYIPRERYSKQVIDLREIWNGGDPYAKGKLGEIAEFLGLEGKAGDGSMVHDLAQACDWEAIAAYCKADVELTRAIYNKIYC